MEFDNTFNNNKGKSAIVTGILLLTVLYIAASLVNTVYAQSNQSSFSSSSSNTTTTPDKIGNITSVQSDQAGTWKLSGTWDFKSLNSNSRTFTSTFSMVKLDGSAMHKHIMNDFKLAGNPTKASTGSTYNGTATVSMKEGPVSNVPISITLSDNGNISIMVDPKTTNNHFGNTPIEGKVTA